MKNKTFLFLTVLIFIGCESNKNYPWLADTSFDDAMKLAKDKMILLDFETEW